MIAVLHFCERDVALAHKCIDLAMFMDKKSPVDGLIAYDRLTNKKDVESIREKAKQWFPTLHEFCYEDPPIKKWPEAPNWAWQHVAAHIQQNIKQPWFWWETDAVPLKPGWLKQISDEYTNNGRKFMGHIVPEMGHMNGVGVYPEDTPKVIGRDGLMIRSVAWDYYLRHVIVPNCKKANHLFQHFWTMDEDGNAKLDNQYPPPSFKNWDDVSVKVDFRCATFHRCKDGSLHKILLQHYKDVSDEPLKPYENVIRVAGKMPPSVKTLPPVLPRGEIKMEMFISTYEKDLEWTKYCLKCIEKYAFGFTGLTLVVPKKQVDQFRAVIENKRVRVRLVGFDEVEGKGMLHHMVTIFNADKIIKGADYVLYLDADCMFKEEVYPDDYVTGMRPHYVVRTYNSLAYSTDEVEGGACQWQAVAAKALGFKPEYYTMTRHPTGFPLNLLPHLRDHITQTTGVECDKFILSQKNSFPQGFAEFPTMGGWAFRFAMGHFFWIDNSNNLAPIDKLKNFWSHGGLDQQMEDGRTARETIEGYLC